MKKITIKKILKKKGKKPIVCLTAYSEVMAEILDKYCDIILVGDSVGMVLYGMNTTKDVKLETMINHGRAVKNCTKKSFVVFDMPYNTYPNKFVAYKNAGRPTVATSIASSTGTGCLGFSAGDPNFTWNSPFLFKNILSILGR